MPWPTCTGPVGSWGPVEVVDRGGCGERDPLGHHPHGLSAARDGDEAVALSVCDNKNLEEWLWGC